MRKVIPEMENIHLKFCSEEREGGETKREGEGLTEGDNVSLFPGRIGYCTKLSFRRQRST